MATFWELAARSIGHMFSLFFWYICNFYLFQILVLRAGFWLFITPVPVHCVSITLTVLVFHAYKRFGSTTAL